jgi:hypothetical protein
LFFPPKY